MADLPFEMPHIFQQRLFLTTTLFLPLRKYLDSWEVLIFSLNLKKSAAETLRMIVEVFFFFALNSTDKTCTEWFRGFKTGDFSVEENGGTRRVWCTMSY